MKLVLLAALIAFALSGIVVNVGLAIGHSYQRLLGPFG